MATRTNQVGYVPSFVAAIDDDFIRLGQHCLKLTYLIQVGKDKLWPSLRLLCSVMDL